MKTLLPDQITTVDQAKKLLNALYSNKEHFYPDDDANQLINSSTDTPFTKIEGDKLNELMAQICQLDNFDPCIYLLDLEYDTVITHGLLYAMGIHVKGGFRWSANASEAWRLTREDVEWFAKQARLKKWPYELERIEKRVS